MVVISILPWSHTFVEIDHEIISTVILLPSADALKKVVVNYKRKYVHKLLINVQACPEKSVVRGTDRPAMTIAFDCDIKQQNKQNQ